jgi:hypothetical protein
VCVQGIISVASLVEKNARYLSWEMEWVGTATVAVPLESWIADQGNMQEDFFAEKIKVRPSARSPDSCENLFQTPAPWNDKCI